MADTNTTLPSSASLAEPRGPQKRRLLRPMLIMGAIVLLIVAIIGGTKFVQISNLIAQAKQPQPPACFSAAYCAVAPGPSLVCAAAI